MGGEASNEEAYLTQRIVREALGSPHVTSLDELAGGPLAALSAPGMGASITAIDDAESVLLVGADPLNTMPILDLRLRKAVRHANLRLVVASDRPTALDGGAEETARYLPGEAASFLAALADQLIPERTPARPQAKPRTWRDLLLPMPHDWPASCGPARRS